MRIAYIYPVNIGGGIEHANSLLVVFIPRRKTHKNVHLIILFKAISQGFLERVGAFLQKRYLRKSIKLKDKAIERKTKMELTNDMDFERESPFYFKILLHKNSLVYKRESHVYRILDKEGRTYKIGENSHGIRKKEGASLWREEEVRKLRKETGQAYRSEIRRIFASKKEACSYEARIIKRFRKLYGNCALPGNKGHPCSLSHDRKYVPSAVDLVKGRVNNSPELIEQDQIEHLLIQSHFFDTAHFKWIGLMYRYGMKNCLIPTYAPIDKRDGELPIAIELKMEILEWADKNNLILFYDIHIIAALEALLHVGRKYGLPTYLIEAELDQYGSIPCTLRMNH